MTEIRHHSEIPIVLMGYYNQMLQFGVEKFLYMCQHSGVDGLIIPDLPMDIYEEEYKYLFDQAGLTMTFLVTPQTSENRIIKADKLSSGFLYVVSSSSITGKSKDIQDGQITYFNKLSDMSLESPKLIGFGIHDKQTFNKACDYSNGAIIGSAFIRAIAEDSGTGSLEEKVGLFVRKVKE